MDAARGVRVGSARWPLTRYTMNRKALRSTVNRQPASGSVQRVSWLRWAWFVSTQTLAGTKNGEQYRGVDSRPCQCAHGYVRLGFSSPNLRSICWVRTLRRMR